MLKLLIDSEILNNSKNLSIKNSKLTNFLLLIWSIMSKQSKIKLLISDKLYKVSKHYLIKKKSSIN